MTLSLLLLLLLLVGVNQPIVAFTNTIDIVIGNQTICAVTLDGRLLCWGQNPHNIFDATSSLIIDKPLEVFKDTGSIVTHAALGLSHLCFVRNATLVLCTGGNTAAQCGEGDVASPVTSLVTTLVLPNTTTVEKISAGDNSTCLLFNLNSSTLIGTSNILCWGLIGLPGDPNTLNNLRLRPKLINSGTAVDISVHTHKLAVFSDGSVQGFDFNDVGQLGAGIGLAASPTVQSAVLLPAIGLGVAKLVSTCTGVKHSCVVTLDGRVACTGSNDRGQLGLKTVSDSTTTFTFIPESARVLSVACGAQYTCYVTDLGILKCFGANDFGQLGISTTDDTNVPTAVTAFGPTRRVVRAVLGEETSFAILQDGSVFVWGRNDYSQFGLGQKSFANQNVTTPQLQDALTSLNRNDAPYPAGYELFLAYFFSALAVLVVIFFRERFIETIRSDYKNRFRRQERRIFNLEHVPTIVNKMPDSDKAAALKVLIKLSDYDAFKKKVEDTMKKPGSNASNEFQKWAKAFHIAILAAMIELSKPDLRPEDGARLIKAVKLLIKSDQFLNDQNSVGFVEQVKPACDEIFLPWPIDTQGAIIVDGPDSAALSRILNQRIDDISNSNLWQRPEISRTPTSQSNVYLDLVFLARSTVQLFLVKPQRQNRPRPTNTAAAQPPTEEAVENVLFAEDDEEARQPQDCDNCDRVIKSTALWVYRMLGRLLRPCYLYVKPTLVRFREHWPFYGIILIFVIAIFFVFEAQRADQITSVGSAVRPSTRPGGFGVTFLPIPPQYQVERPLQNSAVPVIYGFMHCNLFFLGLLPLPLMRGPIRALAKYEWARTALPLDDAVFLHRFFAYCIFIGLMAACAVWLYVMGQECVFNDQNKACLAFDMTDSNPVDNVFVLRIIVWSTWFPVLPLMYFVSRGPYRCLPVLIREYYYEIVYYLHILVAYVTILLALIARFQVFYPVLISWIPYFLSLFWEYIRNTYRYEICGVESMIRTTGDNDQPTSVRLVLINQSKWSTRCQRAARPQFSAGQWLYLYVPYEGSFSLIPSVGHPFSIANAPWQPSNDQQGATAQPPATAQNPNSESGRLELHIAVKESKSLELHDGEWRFPTNKPNTWTNKLRETVAKACAGTKKHVYVLGPYGTSFNICFHPHDALVVIGAGAGLTAAESVLREFVRIKTGQKDNQLSDMLWFVWQCSSLDDLAWCWDRLVGEIDKVIECEIKTNGGSGRDFSSKTLMSLASSNQIAWLGVTLYVTKISKNDKLVKFKETMEKKPLTEEGTRRRFIVNFLANQIQVGGIDDDYCHIKDLLKHVHAKSRMVGLMDGQERRNSMAVAFCGPSELASAVNSAKRELKNIKVEFAQDGQ